MQKLLFHIPSIIFGLVISSYAVGLLDISILEISAYELRWSNVNFDWHYRKGDVFTGSESITRDQYEDGLIAFSPSYKKRLQKDLQLIADKRKYITSIDEEDYSYSTDKYRLTLCLDHKKVTVSDSSRFVKLVDLEVLASFELYEIENDSLVYASKGKKFRLRNKVVARGLASRAFLENKIDELWMAQVANNIPEYINDYKTIKYSKKLKDAIQAYMLYSYFYAPVESVDIESNRYLRFAYFLNTKNMDDYIKANE